MPIDPCYPKKPEATAFPTVFPADAAKAIGNAIINRTFTKDLIEPIYDLVGYGLHLLLGSAPQPPTPVGQKVYSLHEVKQAMLGATPPDADEMDTVGRYLLAASDVHTYGASPSEAVKALPWKSILQALVMILQGIILGVEPSPYPEPPIPPAS